MSQVGTTASPLRVAIIGAGPAGFYAAAHLFKQKDLTIEVDLFDRLPTPYGLVRTGVAPDHQKIKVVQRAYAKTARSEGFRFFGNVEVGRHLIIDDLRAHYHYLVYTTGAPEDRRLGLPGEDLGRIYSATDFVAWYNGHPDYRNHVFDLSQEQVVIIGVGNVAVDVARILCRSIESLSKTDITDYALDALAASRIKEVILLGRRGPAQAAFTTPEIKELGELDQADVLISPEDAAVDPLSQEDLDASGDRPTLKKLEIIQSYSTNGQLQRPKRLHLRFLISPTAFRGNGEGVTEVDVVRNELYRTESGALRPRSTDHTETLQAGAVFRSVGYRGVAMPGVPFHSRWGIIPNEKGRVTDPDTSEPVVGEYAAGWIKRGPTGVIGTNKADAVESIECLLGDFRAGRSLNPQNATAEAALQLVRTHQPDHFSFEDWQRLDELEQARGEPLGRPRVKFTSVADMLNALGR